MSEGSLGTASHLMCSVLLWKMNFLDSFRFHLECPKVSWVLPSTSTPLCCVHKWSPSFSSFDRHFCLLMTPSWHSKWEQQLTLYISSKRNWTWYVWSDDWKMLFIGPNCMFLQFAPFPASKPYNINEVPFTSLHVQKDLVIIISTGLSLSHDYNSIAAKAYINR